MNMLGYIVTEQHISAYFHVQQVAGQVVIYVHMHAHAHRQHEDYDYVLQE